MKDQGERRVESMCIANCTAILEHLNMRLCTSGPNWRQKQLNDWLQLRVLVNQQIARIELLVKE